MGGAVRRARRDATAFSGRHAGCTYNIISTWIDPSEDTQYIEASRQLAPASLSQKVGAALGAQAGESRLRGVAEAAGFSSFRRATETPSTSCSRGAIDPGDLWASEVRSG